MEGGVAWRIGNTLDMTEDMEGGYLSSSWWWVLLAVA